MMACHTKIRFLITMAIIATASMLSLAHSAFAQHPTPSTTNIASAPPYSVNEEPPTLTHARSLLPDVEDGVFAFDDDAFYAFCRHVKSLAAQPDSEWPTTETDTSEPPIPWRFLLERPRDYRGQLVTVEGCLLAKNGFQVAGTIGKNLGTLYQCELGDNGTHGICTAVVIEPPHRNAIRSRVRVQGYFIKVRAYETTGGETGSGPLLVAKTLTPVLDAASDPHAFWNKDRGPGIWLACGTGVLACVWFILRRQMRKPKQKRHESLDDSLLSGHTPPSAADDFAWMSDTSDD